MRYFRYDKKTGIVVGVLATNDPNPIEDEADFGYLEVKDLDPESYLVLENTLHYIGPRPSADYDVINKKWGLNVKRKEERLSGEIRRKRDEKLVESDFTDTLSYKTRKGNKTYDDWQTYRQALRDITQQPGFPLDVVWPEPPATS